jgi:limonene 1,2-monooxygenase
LFARYVMPHFQGSLGQVAGSNTWARENRKQVFGSTVESVRRAFTDFGHAADEEAIRARTLGARDLDPPR